MNDVSAFDSWVINPTDLLRLRHPTFWDGFAQILDLAGIGGSRNRRQGSPEQLDIHEMQRAWMEVGKDLRFAFEHLSEEEPVAFQVYAGMKSEEHGFTEHGFVEGDIQTFTGDIEIEIITGGTKASQRQ